MKLNLDGTLKDYFAAKRNFEKAQASITVLLRRKMEEAIEAINWSEFEYRPSMCDLEITINSSNVLFTIYQLSYTETGLDVPYETLVSEDKVFLKPLELELNRRLEKLGLKKFEVDVFIYPGYLHQ